MAQFLAEKGFDIKILPEALEWHYAGAWAHIFKDFPGYDIDNLSDHWPKTGRLLKSSIALPIFVKMEEDQITELVKTIHEAASKVIQ